MNVLVSVLARPRAEQAAVACERCGVRYRAALTGWACPVCGLDAGRPAPAGPLAAWLADPGNRVVLLVATATAANALVLLLVALAVTRT